jgi:ATP synthase protein I
VIEKHPKRPGKHTQATRQRAFRILWIQAGIAVLAGVIGIFFGTAHAISAWLGGLVYLLPQSYFTYRALSLRNFGSAKAALADLYIGEIWKMLIYIVLLAMVFFLVKEISPFSIFSTLILLHITNSVLQVKLNNRFLKL